MGRSALEELLVGYERGMGWATVIVAVGILGEVILPLVFGKEKRPPLEVALTILCGILLFGGVAGEYVAGSRISTVGQRLREISDEEVARAGKDAAEANARAAEANEKAERERLARIQAEARLLGVMSGGNL